MSGESERRAVAAPSSVHPDSIGQNEDYAVLMSRDLTLPLSGLKRSMIVDTFAEGRGSKRHEAIDIMAPRNSPVHAVEDGTIRKLFLSKAGGNTIYEFDPEGIYCFYYAHLDHYASGLHEGMTVKKGDIIGYVGSTGNAAADAPHLHFAIIRLAADKKWWEGTAINPYPILIRLTSS
jgi:murein DD-endopeptidase MepM/ murein hydrolase activator NlpD